MPAQRIAGRYEVIRPLGEGPLGKVFHVVDHGGDEPGREATVKILRAEALDHDRLDARLAERLPRLSELRATGINPLLFVGKTPLGLLFLASGYTAGESLESLLERRGPLPPARVAAIGRGILDALRAAHAAGIPHGDLHPRNVLLANAAPWSDADPFGTAVVLLDHGVLELVGAERSAALAPYTAPELIVGPGVERAEPTPHSDVFAVGAVLLELLTGRRNAPTSDAPERWRPLLAAALAPDATARPADAAAMLAELPDDAGEAEAAIAARFAALEHELERGVSTGFQRLAERDATLAELRATLAGAQAELATHRAGSGAESAEAAAQSEELARTKAELAQHETALAQRETALASVKTELEVLRRRGGAAASAPGASGQLRGLRTAVVLLALLVILTGALLWRERTRALEAKPAGDDPALVARIAEAERESRLLRDAQASSDAARTEALKAKDAELAALALEIEAWKGTDRDLRAELAQRAEEHDAATASAAGAQLALAQRDDDLAETRTRLSELEIELGRARDPELFALDQLDRVLAALASDDGRAARARYQALLVMDPDLAGLSGLERLSALALKLEEADESADPLAEIARRREAADALAAAQSPDGAARLASAQWVHREGERRAAAIQTALARLGMRHDEARAAFDARLDARWRALLNENPDVDPREVLAIAGWFGAERLPEFLEWQAVFLRDQIESGGMLELPALLKLRHLDAWASVVAAEPALAASLAGREILLFRYARAWRNTPTDENPPPPDVAFQDETGAPATSGWRADLALRARMCAPDAAWPGGVGNRFLYRVAAVVDGETAVTWQLDEVTAAAAGTWSIHRSFYRADGSFLNATTVRIDRIGKRFVEEDRPGGPLCDAGSERAHRTTFEPATDALPPPELVAPESVEAFRAALRARSIEALASETLGMTSWFAPGYGLLALEDPGSFRRELVWAEPRP